MAKRRPNRAASTRPKHFDDVVANAVAFLDRSVTEFLTGNFRFSAVFFYQSVELFMKARLLVEHWSLVVEKPGEAHHDSFERGDFISVGLGEAVKRLRNIAQEDVSEAHRAFDPIRKRRNRVIHFHAADVPINEPAGARKDTGPGAPNLKGSPKVEELAKASPEIEELAREQCVAWFELHKLLTTRWSAVFSAHKREVEILDARMRELTPYLQARFERQQRELQELDGQGLVEECIVCSYRANKVSSKFEGMDSLECLVCRSVDIRFSFRCPKEGCEGKVRVWQMRGGECDVCKLEMNVDEILTHFEPSHRPGDVDEHSRVVCSNCDAYEKGSGTITWVDGPDRFICFNCLEDFESLGRCEWCGERVSTDTEDSFWIGCTHCGGHASHDRDRDD